MLTNAERRRLEELSRAMNERPLTPEESAELGNLMALDMGASREPYQPRSYGREAEAVASTAN